MDSAAFFSFVTVYRGLYLGKLVILELQTVANIHPEREQGNGNLGFHTGGIVFHNGIVAANIHDGTEHK